MTDPTTAADRLRYDIDPMLWPDLDEALAEAAALTEERIAQATADGHDQGWRDAEKHSSDLLRQYREALERLVAESGHRFPTAALVEARALLRREVGE